MTDGTKTLSTLSDFENRSTARPLPDGWSWTTLGEVANPERNRVKPQEFSDLPFIGMDDVESETMRLINTKSSSEMKSSSEHFWPDDVLYGSLRPYLNKVYRPDFEGLCSAEFIVFRSVPHLESKYLQYFLNQWSFVAFINKQNTGDRPRVKFRQMEEYPFPLAPFPEQERIVAEIEKQFTRLDQAVASLRRLQSNLARYKASVLKAACDGRLVPQDPGDEPADQLLARILAERRTRWQAANPGKKYKEPVGVEETAVLPDLPASWTAVKLEQIILSIQTGPFGSSLHKSDYLEDGIPVINPASIIDRKIKPISRMAINEDTRERLKGFILKSGDVIMGRRGEMGRSAMITEKEDGWLCGTGSLILRFAQPISRQFMVYLFGSENVKAHLGNASVGTTMQNLNQKILLNMTVGLPPEDEQKRIVDEIERRLSVATAVEQTITANLSRTERLRQSILHRAFTGQL